MVSPFTIAALVVNIVICFGIPIAACIYFYHKRLHCGHSVFMGMIVFLIAQIFLRLPIVDFIMAWPPMHDALQNTWVYALFLGITAGVFEEGGRYIGYLAGMRENRRFVDAVAYAIGWGGLEAMLMVGVSSVNNLLIALFADESVPLFASLEAMSPVTVLLSSGERILYLVVQIGFSVLVLLAIRKGRSGLLWLVGAVALHLLVDAPLPILMDVLGLNDYIVECYLLILAVAAVWFTIYAKRKLFVDDDLQDSQKGAAVRRISGEII